MIRKTKKELVTSLKGENLSFSDLTLVSEGEYETIDADWNYKDIPHLHHLHNQVDAYPSIISDEFIASIFMLNIGFLRIPISMVNYHSGFNQQNYYASIFFFMLFIDTQWESIGTLKTRVTTTYSIGSHPIFKIFHPFIKFLLKRNYKELMSEDIPMRERRGQLRKWGYKFQSDMNPHSFAKTLRINENNIVAPKNRCPKEPMNLDLSTLFLNQSEYLLGEADHFGLRFVKVDDKLEAFPRLCTHEGACLDRRQPALGKVHCPWHGRQFKALMTLNFKDYSFTTTYLKNHEFKINGSVLTVMFKESDDKLSKCSMNTEQEAEVLST